uniref:Reverse transcriptase zinc-binding domain-containing protein n=1 Tax=Fagus sylvatica TaxID=28930 RepID=A0A2N9IHE7_FAGSY
MHRPWFLHVPNLGVNSFEDFADKDADSTIFRGDICGPIAESMNESMFQLVFLKWRNAFDGLKETNDYKFLSAAGSLMKNMISILDLVLKLLPDDAKELYTARILLYKLFYDQTDQGMTQFLLNLIKTFDTHKQPKKGRGDGFRLLPDISPCDLADLVEMIHKVVQLMENLQARGTLRIANPPEDEAGVFEPIPRRAPRIHLTNLVTSALRGGRLCRNAVAMSQLEARVYRGFCGFEHLRQASGKRSLDPFTRGPNQGFGLLGGGPTGKPLLWASLLKPFLLFKVSRKARRKRKNKSLSDKEAGNELQGDLVTVQNEIEISNSEQSADMSIAQKGSLTNTNPHGKENIMFPAQAGEPEISMSETGNLKSSLPHMDNGSADRGNDDLCYGTGDSSGDEQLDATDEVDFKVSSLISAFANNNIIHKLCWLLKFYKSNSASTNHYIICMLRRITDDLELSPMLYQLSIITTFHSILVEQKSCPSKEYANIVDFLASFVRRMLRKMKSQPILFVEILFWKTRRESHYINAEYLLHEIGSLKKDSRNWENIPEDAELGSSQAKGWTRRNIADALGEDEADVVISHELGYQNNEEKSGEMEGGIPSISDSEINGEEKSDNRGQSMEHESERAPRRKKRIFLGGEMEGKIKDLYEKFKDDRHCSRLIAEVLDPDGKVSPAQISNKLRQLGLKVAPRKKMRYVDKHEGDGKVAERVSNLHNSDDYGGKHKRKRVSAFSEDQEAMIRALYEKFKEHKRCSYMIANALDAESKFTAVQVSHKLKQLGLWVPQQKRFEAKMHIRNEDSNGLFTDKAHDPEDETLLSLLNRSKKENERRFGEQLPEEIEGLLPEDDSDDELLSSVLDFMELIYSIPLKGEGDDKLGWRHKPNKGFSVKEYYRCLNKVPFDPFPWKSIWKAKVPPRVAFFSWTAALGRLLTIDNLRKRHLILVDWCCMCKRSGESVDHLLLHCPMAWDLWSVLGLFGVHWVMPCHVLDVWAGWQGCYGNRCNMVVWRMVPHCVMWCLWRERNVRLFEDCERPVSALKLLFFQTLYDWVVAVGISSINSMMDLIDIVLSDFLAVLIRKTRRPLPQSKDEKLTGILIQGTTIQNGPGNGLTEGVNIQDVNNQCSKLKPAPDENAALSHGSLNGTAEAEGTGLASGSLLNVAPVNNLDSLPQPQVDGILADFGDEVAPSASPQINLMRRIGSGNYLGVAPVNNLDNSSHQLVDEELEDLVDELPPNASPKSNVMRRKLRMVLDLEDDD